jgi:hypothetical protein
LNTAAILNHSIIATAFINRVKDLKMIKFTKKAGVAAAISAVLGTSAHAAVFNATASFRTIADVVITEQLALSFGTAVTGKAGTNCIIKAAIANGASIATETVSGSGCSLTGAASGEYIISGVPSTTVTILMATAVDPDFTFAPAGEFNSQQGTTDVITAFFADSPINVVLDGTNAGLLGVGGELSITNNLNATTSFAVNYDISVVY